MTLEAKTSWDRLLWGVYLLSRAGEGLVNVEGVVATASLGMAAEEARSRGTVSGPWRARTKGRFKCGVIRDRSGRTPRFQALVPLAEGGPFACKIAYEFLKDGS